MCPEYGNRHPQPPCFICCYMVIFKAEYAVNTFNICLISLAYFLCQRSLSFNQAKVFAFSIPKSLLSSRFKGLHFARPYKSLLCTDLVSPHQFHWPQKSPFALQPRKSSTTPRTSKVCLRSRAFEVFHKQNYRTFHHEKRGSDEMGHSKVI